MKKSLSLLTFLSLATLVTSMWSCQPKDTPPAAVAEVVKLETGDANFPSTSAGFKINVSNIESYVYRVEEGENRPTPEAVMMYAEAKEIFNIKDGEHNVMVYGMEGGKTYTVHFAFKLAGQNQYMTKSVSTATASYTRLINIIAADRFELKVHFNVPAGQHFRYTILPMGTYYGSGDDVSKLNSAVLKQGPQTITYKDGGPTGYKDPDSGEDALATVKPGNVFVVMMAYCNEKGEIDYKGGDRPWTAAPQQASAIKPNEVSYTEKCTDEHYAFVDPYAKATVITAQPKVGEGKFVIEKQITELSSAFKITPPSSVTRYGVIIMDEAEYKKQVEVMTEDGVLSYVQSNFNQPFTGEQIVSNSDPLEKGVKYKLIVIGECDQTAETQIREVLDFEPIVSTKPAVELVITDVTTEADGPYKIVYNIKAPNKDCFGALYILNYVKEVEPMLGSGMSYSDIIFEWGEPISESDLAFINSNEGLTLPFDTYEDMDNRLIMASFNDEEKMVVYHKDIRSAAEKPKARVESPLFNSLIGDWNVEFKYYFVSGDQVPITSNFTTKIVNGPAPADPTFVEGNEVYERVLEYYRLTAPNNLTEAEKREYAKKALGVELDKYKEAEPKFKQKYRDQNRVALNGFKYQDGVGGTEFFSSWDLFCNTQYASYDVDQLFFDYGPKFFLEIHEGNRITLETNTTYIAPISYYDTEYRVGGYADNTACYTPFEVIAEGNDKLTIKYETAHEGVKYPFAIISGGKADVIAVEDIVLTRATPAQAAAAKKANDFNQSLAVFNLDKKPRRTSLAGSTAREFKPLQEIKIPLFKGL